MQNVRSLSTYQNMKHQINTKYDTSGIRSYHLQEIFHKCIGEQKLADPFIREVSWPLKLYLYSKRQLSLVDRNANVAYLDATGTVVMPPRDVKTKRTYMYSLSVNIDGIVVPIIIIISAVHNTNAIACMLDRLADVAAEEHRKLPLFEVVVSDWSWPNMASIMKNWNYMTPLEYLKKAFECVDKHNNNIILECMAVLIR